MLFTEHDVHRICADCDTRNDRSVSLLERVGTRREAHHHKSAWWKGEWTDDKRDERRASTQHAEKSNHSNP